MIGSFKAEILKLGKRPATWVLLGVVLALTQLFGYLLPYSSWLTSDQNFQTQGLNPQAVLAGTLPGELVPTSLGGFPVFAGALALILGAPVKALPREARRRSRKRLGQPPRRWSATRSIWSMAAGGSG